MRQAARCDQDRGRAKSEAAAHGKLAANASAIGNAIANRNLVSINSHRCNRGGSIDAKPASSARALIRPARRSDHIFTPCSAKYFTAPGCHGIGEFFSDWFSSVMFFASACTIASSSRFSMKVLTMS
jgi:hypothetical protein